MILKEMRLKMKKKMNKIINAIDDILEIIKSVVIILTLTSMTILSFAMTMVAWSVSWWAEVIGIVLFVVMVSIDTYAAMKME